MTTVNKKLMKQELQEYGFFDTNYNAMKSLNEMWNDFCSKHDSEWKKYSVRKRQAFNEIMLREINREYESVKRKLTPVKYSLH